MLTPRKLGIGEGSDEWWWANEKHLLALCTSIFIYICMCSNDFCTIFYDSERLWSAISLDRLVTLTDGFNSCN